MPANVETTLPPIMRSVRVPCPREKAFAFFTADLGKWWPLSRYSICAQTDNEAKFCAIEPKVGGRIYEKTPAGAEHSWGKVIAWEPPAKFGLSWHPGRLPDTAQTLMIEFESVADGTEVTLTHTGWEKLGEAAQETRTSYESGWGPVLELYKTGITTK